METNNNVSNDSATYLKGYRLYALLISLMLGTMLVAIDNTIIGVAVPKITTEFKALDDIGWYSSAYLIAVTALQPTYGKVYVNFGVKVIYLAAIIVFEAGSVICATAFNSSMFIVGRAIAGIGAGAIFQGALGAINLVAPLPKRPFYFSIVVSVFALAVCIGPIIGGAITDRVSWRWCFWINLPIGCFACIFSLVFLRYPPVRNAQNEKSVWSKLQNMDGLGALTLVGGVTCLLLALQWGGQSLPWNSAKVIGLFVGFGLLTISFGYTQWRLGEHATIPLRILRQRSILMGCIFIALLDMTAYIFAYYMPFYFQGVKGTTALTSGIRFMPLVIPQITTIILSGAVVSKYGHYVIFMAVGPILTAVGTGLITHIGPDTPTIQLSSFLVVVGLGLGLCMQQPYTAVAMVLEQEDVPIGNALMVFLQQLGGAIAVPIGETIFLNVILTEASELTPDIPPHTIIAAGSTGLNSLTSNASVLRALHILYSKAVTRTFVLAVVTAAVALPFALLMDWRVPKKRSGEEIPGTESTNSPVVVEMGSAEDIRGPSDFVRQGT